jgi:hypothetical protein
MEGQGVSPSMVEIDGQLNEVECHIETLREQLREVMRTLAELRLKESALFFARKCAPRAAEAASQPSGDDPSHKQEQLSTSG